MFGTMPSYGLFVRHAARLEVDHVTLSFVSPEQRPAVVMQDVASADFDHFKADHQEGAPLFRLRNVIDFVLHNCPGIADTARRQAAEESF